MSHRDRLRRKVIELDQVLDSGDGTSASVVRRSNSLSPTRGVDIHSKETRITRDFSVVTLEVQRSMDRQLSITRDNGETQGKLSDELFSYRTTNGNGNTANSDRLARSVSISEDVASITSEQMSESSVSTASAYVKPTLSHRLPASARQIKSNYDDSEKNAVRNEFIAVGIGLIFLLIITYVVQYCARHGYLKIPEHEPRPQRPHDEL